MEPSIHFAPTIVIRRYNRFGEKPAIPRNQLLPNCAYPRCLYLWWPTADCRLPSADCRVPTAEC